MDDKIKQASIDCEKCIDEYIIECNDTPIEDVYNIHYDTAGNLYWIGTKSGEHIVKKCCEYPTMICRECCDTEVEEC